MNVYAVAFLNFKMSKHILPTCCILKIIHVCHFVTQSLQGFTWLTKFISSTFITDMEEPNANLIEVVDWVDEAQVYLIKVSS